MSGVVGGGVAASSTACDGVADADAVALLRAMGLIAPGDEVTLSALTGGVSSDIWLVRRGQETFVLKRAREQLKVAAEWHVPVARGASEAAWLEYVGSAVPGRTPAVLAVDLESFAIALEYLDGRSYRNWKSELLAGRVDVEFAGQLGQTLGQIHAASTRTPGLAERFANQELFEALRIEPYLERTAAAVPAARDALAEVIDGLRSTRMALVHGDMSPKNILVGQHPVLLDAECATWSDPAFDVAFCLSHLALKAIHLPAHAAQLHAAARRIETAYRAEVNWEDPVATQDRIDRVLPALLLARVAGASPVDYLTPEQVALVHAGAVESLNSGRRVGDVLDEMVGRE